MLAFDVALPEWFRGTGLLGGFESEVDMVAFVELGDDDFDMPAGRNRPGRNSLVCGSREKRECGIFLQNFMNGDADLVFIGAGFRLDGKGNEGSGKLRR